MMVLKHFVELTVKSSTVVHNWPPWKTKKTELCCPIMKKKEKNVFLLLFVCLTCFSPQITAPVWNSLCSSCYSDNSCKKKAPLTSKSWDLQSDSVFLLWRVFYISLVVLSVCGCVPVLRQLLSIYIELHDCDLASNLICFLFYSLGAHCVFQLSNVLPVRTKLWAAEHFMQVTSCHSD